MKAFVLKEPGVVGYEQVPEPVLTPYGVQVRSVTRSFPSSTAREEVSSGFTTEILSTS